MLGDNTPIELASLQQWVCWVYEDRGGKPTKVLKSPYSGSNASVTDPASWGWFPDAVESTQKWSGSGLGFVFTEVDPYVGIDIDNCICSDGSYTDEGKQALAAFGGSYHEVSPSGKGLKFWIRAVLPTEKTGRKNSKLGVEAYRCKRFFTVTGNILGSSLLPITDCNEALQIWYARKFPPDAPSDHQPTNGVACHIPSQDIIHRASAGNPDFTRLFNGDWSGHPSQSEADLELCSRIARWTGPDPDLIDEVFRESGLYREKWDSRPGYRSSTIDKAIAYVPTHTQGFYDWAKPPERMFDGIQVSTGFLTPTPPSSVMPMTKSTDFGFIDSSIFDLMTFNTPWLVNYVLKDKQPCIIAGPSKSMKTTFLVELAISLASGIPLWNDLRYSTIPQRVALLSAESGEETLQETARRICQSKGITLRSLSDNLFWAFRAPDISVAAHLVSLRDFFIKNRITTFAIDPAYLCMGGIGDNVNNQFAVGAVLENLSWLMHETKATPILAAHTGKGVKAGTELQLSDIAHAGFGQWARQWFLVNRRTAYDRLNPGIHNLWISYGGSAGHTGSWSVDINEGCVELGRTWEYTLKNAAEDRVVTLPGLAQAEADQSLQRRITESLTETPIAAHQIAKMLGVSRDGLSFKAAIAELVRTGKIAVKEDGNSRTGKPVPRYSIISQEPQEN